MAIGFLDIIVCYNNGSELSVVYQMTCLIFYNLCIIKGPFIMVDFKYGTNQLYAQIILYNIEEIGVFNIGERWPYHAMALPTQNRSRLTGFRNLPTTKFISTPVCHFCRIIHCIMSYLNYIMCEAKFNLS